MRQHIITWTAPASMPHIGGRTFTSSTYYKHNDHGWVVNFGEVARGKERVNLVVKAADKPEVLAQIEAIETAKADRIAKIAAIEGLAELRAALDAEAQYQEDFARMMEDEGNDGARPPVATHPHPADLATAYPVAALYLRAEDYRCANHWRKVKAGYDAIELIVAGDIGAARAALDDWAKDIVLD